MLKRFILGFAVGMGAMYYYLHHGEEVAQDAKQWGSKAASEYRGDKDRKLADEVLNTQKRR
jgi:hypothetical protein